MSTLAVSSIYSVHVNANVNIRWFIRKFAGWRTNQSATKRWEWWRRKVGVTQAEKSLAQTIVESCIIIVRGFFFSICHKGDRAVVEGEPWHLVSCSQSLPSPSSSASPCNYILTLPHWFSSVWQDLLPKDFNTRSAHIVNTLGGWANPWVRSQHASRTEALHCWNPRSCCFQYLPDFTHIAVEFCDSVCT